MRAQVELPAGTLTYDWEKKGVKNLNLRLRPDGTAAVSTPRRVTQAQVEAFLQDKADWIARAQARQKARRPAAQDSEVVVLGRRLPVRVLPGERDEAHIGRDALTVCQRDPRDAVRRRELVRQELERAGRPVLEDSLRRMYELVRPLGVAFPVMTTRWAKTRWGSCSSGRGRISINKALIGVPPAGIDYVLLHELVHFLHPNHSPAFYARLASLMPDYRERERLLRAYTPRLP